MKKICLFLCVFALCLSCVTLASNYSADENSGDVVYIDTFEEYQELLNSFDTQAIYKEEYEEQVKSDMELYEDINPVEVFRAKILEASDEQEYYELYSGDGLYKISYQNLKIEILEGDYKGQTFEDVKYYLSYNLYETMSPSALSAGQTVFVNFVENYEGGISPYIASTDSSIDRAGVFWFLVIVALIVTLIYLSGHGAKMLVSLVLFVDLIFVVAVPLIVEGMNVFLLVGIITILSAITIAVLKLGIKPSTFAAITATVVIVIIMIVFMYIFDGIANMKGIDVFTIDALNTIPLKIDFHALNIAINAIIMFYVCIIVSCEVAKVYETKSSEHNVMEKTLEEVKPYVADKVFGALTMLIMLKLPRYIILVASKYSATQLINSETFLTDLAGALFVAIAAIVVAPLTVMFSKAMSD